MTCALDFETKGIESRPKYPPRPVGLAYAIQGGKSGYLAFGHPTANNSTANDARKLLRSAFRGDYGPCVFHNCAFDIDVAQVHFGVGWPKEYHDTMFLGFLDDPRALSLGLKPLAQKYLRRPATERDAVFEWLLTHIKLENKSGRLTKIPKSQLGAYISEAPGDLVGAYATADAEMTIKLFEKLSKIVKDRRMWDAYMRDIRLVPTTMEMERTGLRVDRKGLDKLSVALTDLRDGYDTQIKRTLKVGAEFNVDSGPQLGERLAELGKLSRPTLTATGKQSTAKGVLLETCNDKKLAGVLSLRSVADKYLTGFVTPWLEKSSHTGGYVQPRFNQVRGSEFGGTRSGRFSSSDPNFQNIPANVEDAKDGDTLRGLILDLEACGIKGFRGLRDYFLTDPGKLWVACDYSQQELRILAHFEGGSLMAQYLRDPTTDVHQWVRELIRSKTGIEWPRKFIKTVVFMLIYGGGSNKLAQALGLSPEKGKQLRDNVLDALPGVRKLMYSTKGEIVTWGGRIYPVEEPLIVDAGPDDEGDVMTFEYKQLNYLIQGSAADCTKQGMLNVAKALPDCRIALQVHDELAVLVDRKEQAHEVMRAMCAVGFNVPMLAEPKISKTTWARAA